MLTEQEYLAAHLRYKNMKTEPHERQRYHALLLLSDGYTVEEVADILRVTTEGVRKWIRQYQTYGLAGMRLEGWGGERGQRRLSEEALQQLDGFLRTEAPPGGTVGSGWTLKQILNVVEEQCHVKYRRSGMKKLLKRMGWSYQRGRAKYIKQDPTKVNAFTESTQEQLEAYARSGKQVIPVAEDETKVKLEGTIGWRWNPLGQQPQIADGGRGKQSVSIYGISHLGTGEEFTLQTEWQDSQWTCTFLEELQAAYPAGEILLFWDRAGHHKGAVIEKYLQQHPRIVVMPFPPYSPDLNPKEPTWHQMREEVTHHHWYDSLNSLIESICDYYKRAETKVVNFLAKFGFTWKDGYIVPLPAA
jgi:transposase